MNVKLITALFGFTCHSLIVDTQTFTGDPFNAKIKQFRAQPRGVIDIKFFLFRLMKQYA